MEIRFYHFSDKFPELYLCLRRHFLPPATTTQSSLETGREFDGILAVDYNPELNSVAAAKNTVEIVPLLMPLLY